MEFARPGPKSDVQEAYFGCTIRYGARRNALVLKSAELDRPFPGHNPELLEMLTPALASALRDLQADSSISEQVKVVLRRNLASGRPELSDVAQHLGMSERTLHRRITDEGNTFRELLMEARQGTWTTIVIRPIIRHQGGGLSAWLSGSECFLSRLQILGRSNTQPVAGTQR